MDKNLVILPLYAEYRRIADEIRAVEDELVSITLDVHQSGGIRRYNAIKKDRTLENLKADLDALARALDLLNPGLEFSKK